MTRRVFLALLFVLGIATSPAQAAALSVSPIRLDVVYPGNTTRLTLRNSGAAPITAQVRVFLWSQRDGKDHFAETRNVVVSPPIATLTPGADFHVRILRTVNAPIQGQEAYRVVVDEVPETNRVRHIGLTVAIRYALPLFFISQDTGRPKVEWTVRMINGRRTLVATNSGDMHLRISNLAVGNLKLGKGLQGYVLGHSTRVFDLPRNANPAGAITADTDQGRLNAAIIR